MRQWVYDVAAVIAIAAFMGMGSSAAEICGYDKSWTKWIIFTLFLALAYRNSHRLLIFLRKISKSVFRWWMAIKIIEPQVGESASDRQFTVRGTYWAKPDPEKIMVFHKAREGYYPQPLITVRPEIKQWAGSVTIGNIAHENYTIVVAKCSEDLLCLIKYFYEIESRKLDGKSLGWQAFFLPEDTPGFCELAKIQVKFIPRIIDGGSF